MSFNSIDFLIYLPIVLLVYFVIPDKIKHLWLLAASYYFYMCWNAKYALLILTSTVVTYVSGLLIEKVKNAELDDDVKTRRKKLVVAGSFIINLGILAYFKYFNFALSTFAKLLALVHITVNVPTFDILLPVGISFYTFQALSYTMDVYRDDIYAEKNFFRYALFVSFFPQLVAGPIERSKNLLKQLAVVHKFDFDNFREGLLLLIWGFFLKIVLADRIAVFTDTIFADWESYPGWYLAIAAVIFNVRVYCDFYGYTEIATGSAKILGIDLMENFNAPYLATTIAETWRRWHISMTSWFRDYLYFPLGGSRKGKARKYLNIMIVFFVSGLWHGATVCYVIWGTFNGFLQVIGEMLMPIRVKITNFLHIDRKSYGYRVVATIVTFFMFSYPTILLNATSFSAALRMIKSTFTVHNPWILFDGSLYNCGLDRANVGLLAVCLVILFFADICKYNGIQIRRIIMKQDGWFRWVFIAAAILFVMVFGKWGPTIDKAAFVYFQF